MRIVGHIVENGQSTGHLPLEGYPCDCGGSEARSGTACPWATNQQGTTCIDTCPWPNVGSAVGYMWKVTGEDNVRSGEYALKMTSDSIHAVRQFQGEKKTCRVEMVLPPSGLSNSCGYDLSRYNPTEGAEYWYSMSFKLTELTIDSIQPAIVLMQFHPDRLALYWPKSGWTYQFQISSQQCDGQGSFVNVKTQGMPMQIGTWYDFVIRIKWSSNFNNGYYVAKIKTANQSTFTYFENDMLEGDTLAPFIGLCPSLTTFKYGLYFQDNPEGFEGATGYFDNVSCATSQSGLGLPKRQRKGSHVPEKDGSAPAPIDRKIVIRSKANVLSATVGKELQYATLLIFDATGKQIGTYLDESGMHTQGTISWDLGLKGIAVGLYFYKLKLCIRGQKTYNYTGKIIMH